MTPRRSRTGAVLAIAAVVMALSALFSVGAVTTTSTVLEALPELPEPEVDVEAIDDLDEAVDRSATQPSVVVAADGSVIGRFKSEHVHIPLAVGEVPEVVETAVLAAEDDSFRSHRGFEPSAILRALSANLREGTIEQGGSTITQQLAKNLFTDAEDTFQRKLEELQIAIDLEERFTKDEILTAYVNSVFLGNGAFGFEAGARTYFDKPASELDLAEAALLAGVIPAPSARDPRVDPAAAERARNGVLERVRRLGWAPEDEVDAALARPVEVLAARPSFEKFPFYVDYVRRHLLDVQRIPPAQLFGGGLRIETALDPRLQTAALEAVRTHLPDPEMPEAAVAVVEVGTGEVRALAGGRDFAALKVNLAVGAAGGGSGRQTGSAFKSFVLATAFEQGFVPGQRIEAPREYLPATVSDPKPVHNFNDRGYGKVTLREATVRSINTAYMGLTEAVGAGEVAETATRLGIDGLPDHVGPSIGIGAYESSPLDMAAAYAGFAADGARVTPSPVTRILDADGEEVFDLVPSGPGEPAVSTQTARLVTDVLVDNVRRGTATRAQIGRPAAAKTGTGNEFTNAWLVGYSPQFAAAVWVGHPEGNVPMRDVAGFRRVTGGSLPSIIWHDVMVAAHDGVEVVGFEAPEPPGDPVELLPGVTTTTAPPSTSSTTTSSTTTTTEAPTTTSSTTSSSTTTSSTTTTTEAPTTTTAPPSTTTTAPPSTTTTTTEPTSSTTTTTEPTSSTTTTAPQSSP